MQNKIRGKVRKVWYKDNNYFGVYIPAKSAKINRKNWPSINSKFFQIRPHFQCIFSSAKLQLEFIRTLQSNSQFYLIFSPFFYWNLELNVTWYFPSFLLETYFLVPNQIPSYSIRLHFSQKLNFLTLMLSVCILTKVYCTCIEDPILILRKTGPKNLVLKILEKSRQTSGGHKLIDIPWMGERWLSLCNH